MVTVSALTASSDIVAQSSQLYSELLKSSASLQSGNEINMFNLFFNKLKQGGVI
jgi:hypothetical protein